MKNWDAGVIVVAMGNGALNGGMPLYVPLNQLNGILMAHSGCKCRLPSGDVMLREDDLPKLNVSGAKGADVVKRVVFPPAVESPPALRIFTN
jgi:hypothetical protein